MKTKKKEILTSICVVLYVAWIFHHSWMIGSKSSSLSIATSSRFYALFESLHLTTSFQSFHFFIRKVAHFVEYAGLGFLVTLILHFERDRHFQRNYYLFFLLFVPFYDEWIQYFTPNRSSQFKDVLLDMSGYLVGSLLIYLILKCISKKS